MGYYGYYGAEKEVMGVVNYMTKEKKVSYYLLGNIALADQRFNHQTLKDEHAWCFSSIIVEADFGNLFGNFDKFVSSPKA